MEEEIVSREALLALECAEEEIVMNNNTIFNTRIVICPLITSEHTQNAFVRIDYSNVIKSPDQTIPPDICYYEESLTDHFWQSLQRSETRYLRANKRHRTTLDDRLDITRAVAPTNVCTETSPRVFQFCVLEVEIAFSQLLCEMRMFSEVKSSGFRIEVGGDVIYRVFYSPYG
jgi:hypothetical protein